MVYFQTSECTTTTVGNVMQKQVERKTALTESMLKDKLLEVKGAVMICYPMGLPQYDPMRMILDGQDSGPAAVRSFIRIVSLFDCPGWLQPPT